MSSREHRYFPDKIKVNGNEYKRFTEGGSGYYYVRANSFDPWYLLDEVGELYVLINGVHTKSDKEFTTIWDKKTAYEEMLDEADLITGGVFG